MNTNDAFNPCPETTEAILAEMGARQLNFIQLAARYNTTVLRFTRWLNSPEISALFLEIQTAIATYIRQGAVLSAPVVPAVMHALSTSLDFTAIRDPANLPAREHARKLVTQILRLSKFTAFGEPRLRAPRARNSSPAPTAEPATASTPTTASTPAASTTPETTAGNAPPAPSPSRTSRTSPTLPQSTGELKALIDRTIASATQYLQAHPQPGSGHAAAAPRPAAQAETPPATVPPAPLAAARADPPPVPSARARPPAPAVMSG